MDTFNRTDVLRIATAGSVDDGKSTLIGRLLFETNSIASDKLLAIEESSKRKGLNYTDLSLLTDGLVAEREQGITIDVAHIYFSTPKRKFIIADTPGHIEYTRNMVTGASNADVSIILVDARNGLSEQTKRHLYISQLLRVPKIIVCINKMDLVDYREESFNSIVNDFKELLQNEEFKGLLVNYVPVSSLRGENVSTNSQLMPWYEEENLLEILENFQLGISNDPAPARFPVQLVVRPKSNEFHDFRGYAGKVASGIFKRGDTVNVLPSRESAIIRSIWKHKELLESASEDESIILELDKDIDISRGNMLVKQQDFEGIQELNAKLCWMDTTPLTFGRTYILQHGINRTKVKVTSINYKVDANSFFKDETADSLQINDIGHIQLRSASPVMIDSYEVNRKNGAFILIDEYTNNTVAVGFAF
ncbi:MAG TPA: GTP-binding protein [Roseivirga sp.]